MNGHCCLEVAADHCYASSFVQTILTGDLPAQARQERQREVEDHVQAINKMLSEAQAANSDDDQEIKAEDFEEWNGIEDEEAEAENGGTSNIVDYEDEYVDEDKYTSVKVEAVSVSKDGFEKVYDSDHEETGEEDVEKKTPKEDEASTAAAAKKVWPKKQKKKFRYEHKLERQAEGRKQKARKRAKIK